MVAKLQIEVFIHSNLEIVLFMGINRGNFARTH